MDSNNGGQSFSPQPPETAAEIARKKVLAAYSSTVESIKNLPPEAQNSIYQQTAAAHHPSQATAQSSSVYQPTYSSHSPEPNPYQTTPTQEASWIATPSPEYQRTAVYSNPTPAAPTSKISRHFRRQHRFFDRNNTKSPSNTIRSTSPIESNATTAHNTFSPEMNTTSPYATNTATAQSTAPIESNTTLSTDTQTNLLKDAPIDQTAVNAEWQQYHSAWQDYYKKYYSEYYAKAAQNYLATEKMKSERIATGQTARKRRFRHLVPVLIVGLIILTALFLQYNRLIFAPIMAYVSPDAGSVTTSLEAVDPTINQAVSPEPRLIIPKLNIDVPVEFNIPTASVDEAMNHGVAQFSIPGANALPGQIGNLVITGHSAGDIYSNNPYKFIFSGLERLSPGDLIYINYESVRYTYQMTGSETVEPTDVAALIYETDKPILTLITCTPLGTSRYRLLVTAEQISPNYDENNTAEPSAPPTSDEETDNEPAMPANEPSFFENLWHTIFS